jgi:hypothetical protein
MLVGNPVGNIFEENDKASAMLVGNPLNWKHI